MEQYERFQATFEPQRTDDLRPGGDEWIGWRTEWEAAYVIDEDDGGPYVGQWACSVVEYDPANHPPFVWVPQEDLADIVTTRSGLTRGPCPNTWRTSPTPSG